MLRLRHTILPSKASHSSDITKGCLSLCSLRLSQGVAQKTKTYNVMLDSKLHRLLVASQSAAPAAKVERSCSKKGACGKTVVARAAGGDEWSSRVTVSAGMWQGATGGNPGNLDFDPFRRSHG